MKVLEKKFVFQRDTLLELVNRQHSCVSLTQCTTRITLQPIHLNNVKAGIKTILSKKLKKFDERLDGILLGYQNIKVIADENNGRILGRFGEFEVSIVGEYFVFRPEAGSLLEGVILKNSGTHYSCLVHDYFNANVAKPDPLETKNKNFKEFKVNSKIVFEVINQNTKQRVPSIDGKIPGFQYIMKLPDDEPKKKSDTSLDPKNSANPLNEENFINKVIEEDSQVCIINNSLDFNLIEKPDMASLLTEDSGEKVKSKSTQRRDKTSKDANPSKIDDASVEAKGTDERKTHVEQRNETEEPSFDSPVPASNAVDSKKRFSLFNVGLSPILGDSLENYCKKKDLKVNIQNSSEKNVRKSLIKVKKRKNKIEDLDVGKACKSPSSFRHKTDSEKNTFTDSEHYLTGLAQTLSQNDFIGGSQTTPSKMSPTLEQLSKKAKCTIRRDLESKEEDNDETKRKSYESFSENDVSDGDTDNLFLVKRPNFESSGDYKRSSKSLPNQDKTCSNRKPASSENEIKETKAEKNDGDICTKGIISEKEKITKALETKQNIISDRGNNIIRYRTHSNTKCASTKKTKTGEGDFSPSSLGKSLFSDSEDSTSLPSKICVENMSLEPDSNGKTLKRSSTETKLEKKKMKSLKMTDNKINNIPEKTKSMETEYSIEKFRKKLDFGSLPVEKENGFSKTVEKSDSKQSFDNGRSLKKRKSSKKKDEVRDDENSSKVHLGHLTMLKVKTSESENKVNAKKPKYKENKNERNQSENYHSLLNKLLNDTKKSIQFEEDVSISRKQRKKKHVKDATPQMKENTPSVMNWLTKVDKRKKCSNASNNGKLENDRLGSADSGFNS